MKLVTRDPFTSNTLQRRRTVSDLVEKGMSANGPITMTLSDDSRDRYGDRILQDGVLLGKRYGFGWKLTSFARNPVLMAHHDYSQIPIGRVVNLTTDERNGRKRLRGSLVFASASENPAAPVFANAFKGGVLRAVSVGFRPMVFHEPSSETERRRLDLGAKGVLYAEQELYEISAVSIPANPNALVTDSLCIGEHCRLRSFADRIGDRAPELGRLMRRDLGLGPKRKTFDMGEARTSRLRASTRSAGANMEATMRSLIRATRQARY